MTRQAIPMFRVSKVYQAMALMLASSAVVVPVAQAQTYNAHVDLAGYHFFERDTARTTGLIDVFAPIMQSSNQLWYANIRGLKQSTSPFEADIGMGYRWLSEDNRQLLGGYAFFDRRKTALSNYFNQVTVGGEYWHESLFAGANVYIPVGTTTQLARDFNTVETESIGNDQRHIYYGIGQEQSIFLHGGYPIGRCESLDKHAFQQYAYQDVIPCSPCL